MFELYRRVIRILEKNGACPARKFRENRVQDRQLVFRGGGTPTWIEVALVEAHGEQAVRIEGSEQERLVQENPQQVLEMPSVKEKIDNSFSEKFTPNANCRPMDITLHLEEKIDSRDTTVPGCSPSSEEVWRLAEPVEKYGRTNRYAVRCKYATGFKHKLSPDMPEWANRFDTTSEYAVSKTRYHLDDSKLVGYWYDKILPAIEHITGDPMIPEDDQNEIMKRSAEACDGHPHMAMHVLKAEAAAVLGIDYRTIVEFVN